MKYDYLEDKKPKEALEIYFKELITKAVNSDDIDELQKLNSCIAEIYSYMET